MKRRNRNRGRSRPAAQPNPARPSPAGAEALTAAARKRRRLFRIGALLLPLLLLGVVELILRLAGYGYSTKFFLPGRVGNAAVFTDNAKFGRWFFPPAQARDCAPFSIAVQKPPGTYRIFVLGESAAMGDPEPAFGFARMIAILLGDKFPGARFEVINTGITAINSHVIRPIARDCAGHDGDLWLIYMGNNEVVGPYGAGTIFGAETPPLWLIRASLAVKSLRTGQWAEQWLGRLGNSGSPPAGWGGMKMFLDHQVAADDPRMRRVYSHFERNLADILDAGERAGVRQLVCTVGSNLKDCPPFASLHGAGFGGADRTNWETAFTNGVNAEAAGHFAEALENFAAADRIDAGFAELQFRRGRCLLELGRDTEARTCFERSRDLDTLRFRADSRVNQIIEAQAKARSKGGVSFLDLAGLIALNSPHGIPGEEAFFEHVHFTFDGNYLVARAAVQEIARLLPEGISRTAATNDWLSAGECARRLGWNEWSQYQVVDEVRARLREAPFVNQAGHEQRLARIDRLLADRTAANGVEALQRAALQDRDAVARYPDDAMLHYRFALVLTKLGDAADAISEWRRVIELFPHRPGSYESLGMLLVQAGRGEEAEKEFRRALELEPESVGGLNGLGMALTSGKKYTEAVGCFERALRLNPPYSVGLRLNLTFVLEQLGRKADAERQYREVLRLEPDNPMALVNLGTLLLQEGKIADALEPLGKAVRSHPENANAHFGLGLALERQSKLKEAAAEFQEVLRLEPGHAGAKRHLDRPQSAP